MYNPVVLNTFTWLCSHPTIQPQNFSKQTLYPLITPHSPFLVLRLFWKGDGWQGVWGWGLGQVLELCLFSHLDIGPHYFPFCGKDLRSPLPLLASRRDLRELQGGDLQGRRAGGLLSITPPPTGCISCFHPALGGRLTVSATQCGRTDLHLEDL